MRPPCFKAFCFQNILPGKNLILTVSSHTASTGAANMMLTDHHNGVGAGMYTPPLGAHGGGGDHGGTHPHHPHHHHHAPSAGDHHLSGAPGLLGPMPGSTSSVISSATTSAPEQSYTNGSSTSESTNGTNAVVRRSFQLFINTSKFENSFSVYLRK